MDLEPDAGPGSAEVWKQRGGEAYKAKDWPEAVRCYSEALQCEGEGDVVVACLNNRSACHAQLGDHAAVVADATAVVKRQPANIKALFRRMVALEALGQQEAALADAASVLTMEPKNAQALQVVANKRQSLTRKEGRGGPGSAGPARLPTQTLCILLFTEDRPLQCYACLKSLRRHMKNAILNVHVFWQASGKPHLQSYQLLQGLHDTSRLPNGRVSWVDVSGGKLFQTFSRSVNRLSVEGQQHVLLLSDSVVFHSDVDASAAMTVLNERHEAFTFRLDVNPRIDYFPEADLYASAPQLQHFASDPRVLLWTRWYDASKPAYEAVPREAGWDSILDWTATVVRVEHVQHFFSALLPPLESVAELDRKAADWLSRRQRMKRSEISHRSACFAAPVLVALDPEDFGPDADRALRSHLLRRFGPGAGSERLGELAAQLKWRPQEVLDYFQGADAGTDAEAFGGLLAPECYREQYLRSVKVPVRLPPCRLPAALNPPGPLVTWLVPVRNAEGFASDCVASMLSQVGLGAGSYELVLVDDGSDDGTLALLRRLASEHPCIRLVENGVQLGVGGALREGWAQCRGDFVARLDADDEAEVDRLVKQLRYLEQHPTLSVLGGRTRSFWTEPRKCTIERTTEKEDGRVVAVAWREFVGNQTSRQREQLTFSERGGEVVVTEGSAEYLGSRVVRVGEVLLPLSPDKWRAALHAAQGGVAEVILHRRDPLEPPRGSRMLHPVLVRAMLLFEDCISETTATLRKSHFASGCPFQQEEAEGHWCWLSLSPNLHAANLADSLVRTRRHPGNRAQTSDSSIYASKCAAIQHHLTRVHGVDVDLHDSAALLHFRGPRTTDQGKKLLQVLAVVERSLFSELVHPRQAKGDFWRDFVQGREAGLEKAVVGLRARFKALADEVSNAITSAPEHSPRHHRSRTPPR